MELDKYICVREMSPQNSVVIIEMSMPNQLLRRHITADLALMNLNSRILSLKGLKYAEMFIRQLKVVRQEKCSMRRKYEETSLKKDVLSMFVESRNAFFQKKSDASKKSYSREEIDVLRIETSYQQRQICREIYTRLGPIVTKELNIFP